MFFVSSLCSIFLRFCSIFSQPVTLVTAKINIAVGRRAGAHSRTREESYCGHFARLKQQILRVKKIKCHFFATFSLFGAISTHILIGAQRNIALSYFYSENQLTDKTEDANLISQRHTAFYHILPFHRISHLYDALLFAQQTDANDVANPQKFSTIQETKTGTIHEGQFQQ